MLLPVLYKYKIHHVLIWLIYFSFWITLSGVYEASLMSRVATTFGYFIFHAGAFYFTGYVLLPRYFNQGRYATFIFCLLITMILAGIGIATGLYLLSGGVLSGDPYGFLQLFYMGLSSTVGTVGVLASGKLIIDRVKQDRRERELEHERDRTELQFLKAQVNPHFLFNAINNIYVLIKKDPDRGADTLIRLSNLLRFQLYDCTAEMIPIDKEIEYLTDFMQLEKLRKGDRVKVGFICSGRLDDFSIAAFLLTPLMENAFKFVSTHTDRPNEIRVTIRRENAMFSADFFNTCERIPLAEVGGIGLKNVRRRLELLYPEKHKLLVDGREDSYHVILQLAI